MESVPFAHLHVHTEYSLLDGCANIKKLIDRCQELNMRAVAITDHGNMFGTYKFYSYAKEKKIKPIIGCEFYMCEDLTQKKGKVNGEFNHLILIAKDEDGYHSLCKLNSIAYIDGYYYKPRIDKKLLTKYSSGLICLSACLAGELPRLIMDNQIEEAERVLLWYKDLFKDDYYIELQDHGLEEQKYVNPILCELAKKHGVKTVATNDVHYVKKEHAIEQDVALCIQTARYFDETSRMKFPNDEFYLKSFDEMRELFSQECLENTMEIVDKCHFEFTTKSLLPGFTPPNGLTSQEYLRELAYEGLRKKYKELTKEITDRTDYELEVINKMGFNEYFLIVWDFIHHAESVGIPVGPGRGSGAGSIVAYAIGITKIDPIRFKLLFERFLNPGRVSMPDFDIDFCVDRRGEVIEYVKNKYGKDNVAQIVTFATLASRAAIKDVARVFRMSFAESDKLTKYMNPRFSIAINYGLIEGAEFDKHRIDIVPELNEMYLNNDQVKRVVDIALGLEGSPRNTGMHAAGVVICSQPISEHVPLQKNGDDVTTQFNMKEVEKLGLLKMDFLGLRTLTDIQQALDFIEEGQGKKINLYDTDYQDQNVFKLISSGDTDAVFQLESAGMKKLMKKLLPTTLEDIIAGISLFRPGPMDSIDTYIEGKNHPENVVYKHELLKPILDVTYGCLVYQEQVISMVQAIAGYSLAQADLIRRAMGKKDIKEMERQKRLFIEGETDENGNILVLGATRNGIDPNLAEKLYDEMQSFAEYAFNKSHAAAYAVVAYQTAYLKYYYPVEFLASVINNRITNIDEVKKYTGYCLARGIEILPPDINSSRGIFTVSQGKIRFGLTAVKGVGAQAIEKIVEEREKRGKFKSLEDFLKRVDTNVINKRLIENFILAGAFDSTGAKRSQLMQNYDLLMDKIAYDKKIQQTGQISLFGMVEQFDELGQSGETPLEDVKEFSMKDKYLKEKEVLGICISGNPLEEHKENFKNTNFNTSQIQKAEEGEEVSNREIDGKIVVMGGILSNVETRLTKAGNRMATAKLEDLYGSINVVCFHKDYEKNKELLTEDMIGEFSGRLNVKDGVEVTLNLTKIKVWKENDKNSTLKVVQKLYLKINDSQFEKVAECLDKYPGDIETVIVVGEKKYKGDADVRKCIALEAELAALIGPENYKFMEKVKSN